MGVIRLIAIALLVPALTLAADGGRQTPPGVSGTVFLDTNGNGTLDAGEPGVGNVAVSNQIDVIATTGDGSYKLPGPGTGVVLNNPTEFSRPLQSAKTGTRASMTRGRRSSPISAASTPRRS